MIKPKLPFSATRLIAYTFLLVSQLGVAAEAPRELNRVLDQFLSMKKTSMDIRQTIDWRFSGNDDVVTFQMDVLDESRFHLDIPAARLEVFFDNGEMTTLNHARSQIIIEPAATDALIEQIFVGGRLSDARYKGEKKLKSGASQLDFTFVSDFSEWLSLTVFLDEGGLLSSITLVDYDTNKYIITFSYRDQFDEYDQAKLLKRYTDYQVADLRE